MLTILDQSGRVDATAQDVTSRELQNFRRETGIQVQVLAAPEIVDDQLALWLRLMESHSKTPDIYSIDVIWPELLADHLIDLKPYLASEIPSFIPHLIATFTVNGKLVGIPRDFSTGLLYYRTDLLQKYGYAAPPASWDELERMAARIQGGERAAGNPDFWGYVWEGAQSEALLCNALEWQVSEGGGTIIEDDRTISVNNPFAAGAWQRAARWVGTISPPSVIAFTEWDAANAWTASRAAFLRNWPESYFPSRAPGSLVRDRFDVTTLPAGRAGHWNTLGGAAYTVSRYSTHPREAIALVRYMVRPDVQVRLAAGNGGLPARTALYDDPAVLQANPYLSKVHYGAHLAVRPSVVAGKHYEEVSRAYVKAVHSVLTGEKDSRIAAAELERDLIRIAGFKAR